MSAGLLLCRRKQDEVQILLVHPGGPFWKNKDAGAWSIPKGEISPGEEPLAAAIRETAEELGFTPSGPFTPLPPVTQKSGKTVHAFLCEGDLDPTDIKSNTFALEWPPKSGKQQEFPEVDRAAWFSPAEACEKINPAQIPLIAAAEKLLTS